MAFMLCNGSIMLCDVPIMLCDGSTDEGHHKIIIVAAGRCFLTRTIFLDDDPFRYVARFTAPTQSLYSGGIFQLSVTFPSNYPFKAPTVRFQTKIFHPVVNPDGRICMGLLTDTWSPACTMTRIFQALNAVLLDPGAYKDEFIFAHASQLITDDNDEFCRIAREWVVKYAS
eukprot:TRINITY_DN5380_c0_g1_i1.p1 TRINITY_DN5380_c0_g1~~TRINITY_DN5380_c0_g1_i1.p1  ORF type:complete len:189 (+),score=33.40 TRINITY_DN5380_c0_g1_i1:57-569(+)